MEIESIFTEEAEKLIAAEAETIADELRQAAIDEALSGRGKPVEVTASDVRRARDRLTWYRTPLTPRTDFVLRLYAVIGAVTFLVGLLYPYAERTLKELYFTNRLSLLIALSGLALSVMSLLMKYYLDTTLRTRRAMRSREKYKEEETRLTSQNNTR